MQTSNSQRHGSTALAGVFLLLLSGLSPVAFGQDDRDPRADIRRPSETAERFDTERQAHVGRTIVQTVVDAVQPFAPVKVQVLEGNKVFVSWALPVRRTGSVTVVGIIVDDGVPF